MMFYFSKGYKELNCHIDYSLSFKYSLISLIVLFADLPTPISVADAKPVQFPYPTNQSPETAFALVPVVSIRPLGLVTAKFARC